MFLNKGMSFFALILGFVMDIFLGDPYTKYHPVCLMGNTIAFLEKKIRPFCKSNKGLLAGGGVVTVLTVGFQTVIYWLILRFCYGINKYAGFFLETIVCYFMLAAGSLQKESTKVSKALEKSLEQGRKAVSAIVGRDTENLHKDGVIRAAVETVAENTSDGIVAPMFYMALFGAVGGVMYKCINTLDSMIGYKNDKYLYFGRIAAKLDDIANFIPARLSGLLMVLSAYILGYDGKNAFDVFVKCRKSHSSPNSAHTESACAGALGIALGGNSYYFGKLYEKPVIGVKKRDIQSEDIGKAQRLMWCTSLLFMFFVTVLYIILRNGVGLLL